MGSKWNKIDVKGNLLIDHQVEVNKKEERNELVVDKNGNGTHRSIQEAIDEAEPNQTIEIRSGTYSEKLLLTKPLTLKGAGREQTIVEYDSDSVLTVNGISGGTVQGVTFRYTGSEVDADAVNIIESGLSLMNCRMTGATLSGIDVIGGQSNIIGNLCDGNKFGLKLQAGAKGVIKYNEISGNNKDGVVILEEGTAP